MPSYIPANLGNQAIDGRPSPEGAGELFVLKMGFKEF
jgi:hypothetical protein